MRFKQKNKSFKNRRENLEKEMKKSKKRRRKEK